MHDQYPGTNARHEAKSQELPPHEQLETLRKSMDPTAFTDLVTYALLAHIRGNPNAASPHATETLRAILEENNTASHSPPPPPFEKPAAAHATTPSPGEVFASPETANTSPEFEQRIIDNAINSITDRWAYGKFAQGASLDAINAHVGSYEIPSPGRGDPDFGLYPDNDSTVETLAFKISKSLNFARFFGYDETGNPLPEHQEEARFSKAHVMSFLPDVIKDEDAGLILYAFPVRHGMPGPSGRNVGNISCILQLPNEDIRNLREVIRNNPDNAEAFFKKVSGGLDLETNERVRANELAIISEAGTKNAFNDSAKKQDYGNKFEYRNGQGYKWIDSKSNPAVTFYAYSHPIGAVDPSRMPALRNMGVDA